MGEVDRLEVFVITNGRESFGYVMESIKNQSLQLKTTVIRDMNRVDALNKCVELCQSDYFLRVDDDMVLHPYAFEYYCSRIRAMNRRSGAVYVCRLWEDWSGKPVNGLRMYSSKVCRSLKFQASKLGKVDKVFRTKCIRNGKKQIKDPSIVGIHILASEGDQKKYRDLWRDQNAKISSAEFSKTFDSRIHPYKRSMRRQCRMLRRIRKLNKRYDGRKFLVFIGHKREEHAPKEGQI